MPSPAWRLPSALPPWPGVLAAISPRLAVAHGGRLVSFDQRLGPQQVTGARANHLWVISAGGAAAGGAA